MILINEILYEEKYNLEEYDIDLPKNSNRNSGDECKKIDDIKKNFSLYVAKGLITKPVKKY